MILRNSALVFAVVIGSFLIGLAQEPCDIPFPDSCQNPVRFCPVPQLYCPWEISGLDITYLIAYLRGGPAPRIFSKYDANCSGTLNGSDVQYLIAYADSGGPPPLCCFYDCQDHLQTAGIGDRVWLDSNVNGIQDSGEVGVAGVPVELLVCSNPPRPIAYDTTDSQGLFQFDSLETGSYRVQFHTIDQLTFSPRNQGNSDSLDSDANPETGMTECFDLPEGVIDLNWDAGMHMRAPMQGCVWQLAWWKNHAGFRPQPDSVSQYLPLWLGLPDSISSISVNSNDIAIEILRIQGEYGRPFNGITRLYAQLLAAKLNIANGAGADDISETITTADTYLSTHDWNEWNDLDRVGKARILTWVNLLADYNNGRLGPAGCGIEEEMR